MKKLFDNAVTLVSHLPGKVFLAAALLLGLTGCYTQFQAVKYYPDNTGNYAVYGSGTLANDGYYNNYPDYYNNYDAANCYFRDYGVYNYWNSFYNPDFAYNPYYFGYPTAYNFYSPWNYFAPFYAYNAVPAYGFYSPYLYGYYPYGFGAWISYNYYTVVPHYKKGHSNRRTGPRYSGVYRDAGYGRSSTTGTDVRRRPQRTPVTYQPNNSNTRRSSGTYRGPARGSREGGSFSAPSGVRESGSRRSSGGRGGSRGSRRFTNVDYSNIGSGSSNQSTPDNSVSNSRRSRENAIQRYIHNLQNRINQDFSLMNNRRNDTRVAPNRSERAYQLLHSRTNRNNYSIRTRRPNTNYRQQQQQVRTYYQPQRQVHTYYQPQRQVRSYYPTQQRSTYNYREPSRSSYRSTPQRSSYSSNNYSSRGSGRGHRR